MTAPDDFDFLDQWALCSDSEITEIISNETIAILQRVVVLLGDYTLLDKVVVTHDNFVSIVYEMRKLKREGSWALGEAILEASDCIDAQQLEKAKKVYQRFLTTCSSKFYRDIASNRLKEITRA